MLALDAGDYQIVLNQDPPYIPGSADNKFTYQHVHEICKPGMRSSNQHTIRIFIENDVISILIIASGGATGIHDNSAIVVENQCFVAIGSFIVCIEVSTGELVWSTLSDSSSCFGIYHSQKHQRLISHGEISICGLSCMGEVLWDRSGKDIFTGDLSLSDDVVKVSDFYGNPYAFEIANGNTANW